jgi:hypothetical protein
MKSSATFIRTVVVLCMLAACNGNAGESSGRETQKSASIGGVIVDSSLSEKEKTEALLPSITISYKDLQPELQELITGLREKKVRELAFADRQFIVLKPGPGLYPAVGYGKGVKDLMSLDEIHELMSFENLDEAIYRLVPDKCTVIEAFPDGIYVRETDGENVQISIITNDDTAGTRLSAALRQWNGKKGIELLIKFTPDKDPYFIDFYFYEDDARLHGHH